MRIESELVQVYRKLMNNFIYKVLAVSFTIANSFRIISILQQFSTTFSTQYDFMLIFVESWKCSWSLSHDPCIGQDRKLLSTLELLNFIKKMYIMCIYLIIKFKIRLLPTSHKKLIVLTFSSIWTRTVIKLINNNTFLHKNNAVHQTTQNKLMWSKINVNSEILI